MKAGERHSETAAIRFKTQTLARPAHKSERSLTFLVEVKRPKTGPIKCKRKIHHG